MAKLLAGIFALVALAVCIINRIEPWTATVRGLVAFAVGHFAGTLWESFFGQPGGKIVNAEDLVEQTNLDEEHTESDTQIEGEPAA